MNGADATRELVDLTVAITCYNEAEFIIDTIESVIAALQHVPITYEIIIIDDKSSDDSVERIREHIRAFPSRPITLKVNERNQGLANNYVDGSFMGKGKYYHLVCGDNALSVEHLVRIYRLVGKADMIIPYQIQDEVSGKGLARRGISRTFTWLVNFLSGYNLKYYNGTGVHLRYNVMRWHPISYGFGFQADIITILLEQGATYIQVYSRSVDRKGSVSTALTMRNLLSVIHTLLEIAIRRIRRLLYGKHWPKPVEVKLPAPDVDA